MYVCDCCLPAVKNPPGPHGGLRIVFTARCSSQHARLPHSVSHQAVTKGRDITDPKRPKGPASGLVAGWISRDGCSRAQLGCPESTRIAIYGVPLPPSVFLWPASVLYCGPEVPVGSLRQALVLFDSSVSHSDAAEAAVGQDMTNIVRVVVVLPFTHWGFPHSLTLFLPSTEGRALVSTGSEMDVETSMTAGPQ